MSEKCHGVLFDQRGRPLAQVASVSADLPDGHAIPVHSHPEDQLIFASQGVMTLRTDQGTWVVPPMRAVWIPSKTPHSVTMSGPVAMRTLYFLPRLVKGFPQKCFVMNVTPLLRELILHACTFKRLSKNAPVQKRILEIIVDQLQAVHSIPLQLPHPADARAMRVVQTLLANPGEPKTLQTLCKECGASKRTIERVFLAETKMNFRKWRQQLRLLHALQLLASGEKVTAAALDAGYCSTSAFISMFKKQLGATPTRYFQSWSTNENGKAVKVGINGH
jgi:AraC-like DNA-binding protein/quercetin dioxygenase-like cupin family protein